MIWELIRTGHLAHWWEYLAFITCLALIVGGPTAIWLIVITRPGGWKGWGRRGGK